MCTSNEVVTLFLLQVAEIRRTTTKCLAFQGVRARRKSRRPTTRSGHSDTSCVPSPLLTTLIVSSLSLMNPITLTHDPNRAIS